MPSGARKVFREGSTEWTGSRAWTASTAKGISAADVGCVSWGSVFGDRLGRMKGNPSSVRRRSGRFNLMASDVFTALAAQAAQALCFRNT